MPSSSMPDEMKICYDFSHTTASEVVILVLETGDFALYCI